MVYSEMNDNDYQEFREDEEYPFLEEDRAEEERMFWEELSEFDPESGFAD